MTYGVGPLSLQWEIGLYKDFLRTAALFSVCSSTPDEHGIYSP